MTTTTTDIETRVRAVVGGVLWVAADDIDAGTSLVDYGLDSPTAIELTVGLEHEFGVDIPEDIALGLDTVDDIVTFVRGAL